MTVHAVLWVIFIAVTLGSIVSIWRSFTFKPSEKQKQNLQGQSLYRFTSEDWITRHSDGTIELSPSPYLGPIPSTFYRPTLFWFVGEPKPIRIFANKIGEKKVLLKVAIDQFDLSKVRYRPVDQVVAYMSDFKGVAVEVDPTSLIRGQLWLKRLLFWGRFIIKLLVSVIILSLFPTILFPKHQFVWYSIALPTFCLFVCYTLYGKIVDLTHKIVSTLKFD